jgi:hypothetical protein
VQCGLDFFFGEKLLLVDQGLQQIRKSLYVAVYDRRDVIRWRVLILIAAQQPGPFQWHCGRAYWQSLCPTGTIRQRSGSDEVLRRDRRLRILILSRMSVFDRESEIGAAIDPKRSTRLLRRPLGSRTKFDAEDD